MLSSVPAIALVSRAEVDATIARRQSLTAAAGPACENFLTPATLRLSPRLFDARCVRDITAKRFTCLTQNESFHASAYRLASRRAASRFRGSTSPLGPVRARM